MTAGYETLRILQEEKDFYVELEQKASRLADGIRDAIKGLGLSLVQNRVGSMSTLFFTDKPVTAYPSAVVSNTTRFASYFREMLRQRVYIAPSQFEAGFISIAHTDADIDRTLEANEEALRLAFAS
ncbi:MAG: glutamate-1-semialdehyde 2,1-aminomutase [Bacteroidetes bacterium]|nr:glutamate-1-semialdehyde 2,1-aminomutase [Bacteroidota bacterium]